MSTPIKPPPGYVEVTNVVQAALRESEVKLERMKRLRASEQASTATMKRVAEGTKPPHGQTKHYYKAGFGWRNERIYLLELEVLHSIGQVLPLGSIVIDPRGKEMTILHCHIPPTWSEEADTLQAITWEDGERAPLQLSTETCEDLRFFAPIAPDEPT